MCYTVCRMVHIKYPFLLMEKKIATVLAAADLPYADLPYSGNIKCIECVVK